MENQMNVGDQNTQQIGQNPIDQSSPVPEKPKINYLAMAGVILVCFVVFGFGGYYLGKQSLGSQNYVNDRQNQVSPPSSTPDPTANWKTYTNTKYGFSLKYPPSWEIIQNLNEAPIVSTSLLAGGPNFEAVFFNKNRELFCGPYTCYPSVQIATPIKDNSKIKLSLEESVKNYITSKAPEMKFDPKVDFEKLTIDSHPAIKFDSSVFILSDNYNYIVTFDSAGVSVEQPDYDEYIVFNQILSTFKFLDIESSPSPTSTKTKNLSYKLPSGWSIATDKGNTFSVGYDPVKYNSIIYDLRIDLAAKSPSVRNFFIKNLPYDGGSRHEFIRKNIGATSLDALKTKNTIEINYTITGKNGLFLYNMDLSGSCSIGMVGINGNSALLIESQFCTAESIEPILSTFKLTK